jgi:ABC-2 type transport system permease protein
MSLLQIWRILKKDLWMGPRSGLFLWLLAMPLLMTLLVQVVFGSLFEPKPRLAVVDAGDSAIRAALLDMEGLELTVLDSEAALKEGVEGNDFDGGLVLGAGFDEALRAGEKPLLELFVGGESHASERLVIAVTTIDLVRQLEGSVPPVDVAIERLGDGELLPLNVRLVPFCVIYALLGAGIFLTGLMLVEEKEKGTLTALRIAPLNLREILVAKWVLGFSLAVLMSLITLALNGGFGGQVGTVTLAVVVGAALAAEIGILLGILAADSTTLFALIKGLGILIIGPVIFYIFPDWPQWIAKLFPTYWVIDPIYSAAVLGNGLGEVYPDLLIAGAIIVGMLPVLVLVTRRMQLRNAVGAA